MILVSYTAVPGAICVGMFASLITRLLGHLDPSLAPSLEDMTVNLITVKSEMGFGQLGTEPFLLQPLAHW